MKLPQGMTAEQYIGIFKLQFPDFDRVACAATEEEFCEAVETAVRRGLQRLEDRRKLLLTATPLQNSLLSQAKELELSTELADLLTSSGLPTTAETYVNGHVDIVINHFERGRFRILGECKMDHGPKHHCKGTTQVLGYCSGAEERALCIGFCQKPDVNGRMKETRRHFTGPGGCHDVEETKDHHLPWSFLGVHRHSSGESVEVLHIACNLHEPGGAVAENAEEDEDA